MTDPERKEIFNKYTRLTSRHGAREVYVRHCAEDIPCLAPPDKLGSVCPLIHPDVTFKEFFA